MAKILVSAGGSGGHIIPAVSIIKSLISQGASVIYTGNRNSMEEKIISDLDIPFFGIDVQKLYRKITPAHLKFPFKLINSINKCRQIIRNNNPDAFLGTGGFVSGPAGYTANLMKIPVFLQEQNSYPGLTTRLLSRYADQIYLGNKGAEKYLPKDKIVFTGNPINTSSLEEKETVDFEALGMRKDSPKILLTGGSQGSVILNNAMYEIVDQLLAKGIEIFWQIGRYSYTRFAQLLKNKSGIHYFDFTTNIGRIYNSVDLVIGRAGALSLAEFETKKLPSILIPLPSAAENHQLYNGREMEENGIAVVIEQKNLNSGALFNTILNVLANKEQFKEKFDDSIHKKAAAVIAKSILERI